MNISLFIFLIGLILVIIFYKDFKASIYYIVAIDIFLRLISYLKVNIIKDNAFDFFNVISSDIPDMIRSLNLEGITDVLIFVYIIIYIVFECLIIKNFIKKKF